MQILIGSYFSSYAFRKPRANQNLHSLQSSKVLPIWNKGQEIFGRTLDPKSNDEHIYLVSLVYFRSNHRIV